MLVIHDSVSYFHSLILFLANISTITFPFNQPTGQPDILCLLLFASIFKHYSYRKHQEKRTSCDLLLHIHSKAGSSFLWLCHPLTVSPISLLLYVLSPASQVLLYFFKDSNSSLGYPLGCGHSPETHVPGLRQAFLAPRPGQSQATTVTWLSHQTPNCWFRTTTSVTLYTWIPSGCCDECLHIHTHSHTSTHTERRHLNEWIKEEQMAGLLPLKNTLVDFCLVWHLMSNLLPPYRLDLHPTLEHLQLRTPPLHSDLSRTNIYAEKHTSEIKEHNLKPGFDFY